MSGGAGSRKPRLTDVVSSDGVSGDELLRVAMAVENLSDHPLAAAVVQDGKERLKGDSALQAHDVQSITGRGVKASVDGEPVYIHRQRQPFCRSRRAASTG
jgi:Zn2+/Cd2+-exporting ATPase